MLKLKMEKKTFITCLVAVFSSAADYILMKFHHVNTLHAG